MIDAAELILWLGICLALSLGLVIFLAAASLILTLIDAKRFEPMRANRWR